MADVNISKYRASVVRDGSKPASPGFVVSEGQDPVNPPGTNNFVPYTGATANVELGEFGVEAGFVTLDTTPTNIPTDQGAIYWDEARSTAALIMNGTLQHIGQDSFFYVKNSSGSTIPKGTCVGFAGTDGGSGHILITPFIANGSVPSTYFMGVTSEAIANGAFGQVMHFGELEGINTSGFTAGALLYASSTVAGAFQTTAPVAPNNIILVAAAVNSKNNGAIVVRPTLGSNFGTNESVKLTSVTDKDLLQYTVTAGIGVWENKTLSQVIGSAYVPSTRTITINGVTQDLSANRTFNVGDMLLDTIQTVTARKDYNNNTLQLVVNGTSQKTVLTNSAIDSGSYSLAINAFGFNASNNLYFSKGGNNNGVFAFSNAATRTYTLKDASGTLAFTSDIPSLSGYVQGSGTTNYVSKFTASGTIGNSQIFDNGTNVGIGTASPNSILELSTTTPVLRIQASSTSDFHGLEFRQGAGLDATIKQLPSSGEFRISNGRTTGWGGFTTFYIDTAEAARFTPSRNLLVGTTTDNGARVQVSGTAQATKLVSASNAFSGTLDFGTGSFKGIMDYTASTGLWSLNNQTAGASSTAYFQFQADSSPILTMLKSGNVGIGTTNPLTRLMVQDTANTYVAHFSGLNQANGIAIGTNSSNVAVIQGYTRTFSATNFISMQADGGNISIGSATDTGYKLFVNGNTYIRSGGNTSGSFGFVLQDSSANNLFLIRNDGAATFSNLGTGTVMATSGTLSTISDSSYKVDDGYIDSALEKVLNLKPRYFYWNKKSGLPTDIRQLGFYAQEVNQALGEEVANTPKDNNTAWGIADRSLIAMLTKAIQELKQEIDTLKN